MKYKRKAKYRFSRRVLAKRLRDSYSKKWCSAYPDLCMKVSSVLSMTASIWAFKKMLQMIRS